MRSPAFTASAIQRLEPASSIRATVQESLTAAIVSGELPPGTLVSVPTLAAQFGVSGTPVREAMLNLEKLGFVRALRNKGFRVTEVSEQDLNNLVQVRRWLEGPAMRIVAERLDASSASELGALADVISAAAERNDFRGYLAADFSFHMALLGLVENGHLVELVSELRRQTRLVGLASLRDTVELTISAREHHLLLELLVAGKGAEAQRLMDAHIGHILGWWSGRSESADASLD